MLNLLRAGALALVCLSLSACSGVNAWVAGAENQAITDAAGAADNIHTANVAAAQGWARLACGLTLGGLAGASSASITESAMKLCTPAGVSIGGVQVQQNNPAVGNPFALPGQSAAPASTTPPQVSVPAAAPAAFAAPRAAARKQTAAKPMAFVPVPATPDDPTFAVSASAAPIQPQAIPLVQAAPVAAPPAEPIGGANP